MAMASLPNIEQVVLCSTTASSDLEDRTLLCHWLQSWDQAMLMLPFVWQNSTC